MRRFDYTNLCECGKEDTFETLAQARKAAKKHLREVHTDKTPNWEVFIDQYDLVEGELSGKYYKITRN